ncbi:CRISPR-associated protein Cas10/Cmr2, subtype III-B [Rivularia sp. PCC 7116]|uniref:type III-B CRISPR-associated protein Cas10/Cmr2 n=1 Tax=Rivularia sp. PCC 7116 TaxID=373994 RepID=UPI00029ECF44|nr:type III-B CRISPR-associated protein Cas10/Cmr2 [Rivularia sp. PCC 7116]AFY55870.1 CRISPR-associated protein Cas10/Cmr2, subtype III-B [Rivularia sp. PCC 7116]
MKNPHQRIITAITWCLAWGEQREPKKMLSEEMLQALRNGETVTDEVAEIVEGVKQLQGITEADFPQTTNELLSKYGDLWKQNTKIGLVYGGATKIKQYVFEAAKLPYIRGASAILDRINLVDLPAFFGAEKDKDFLQLKDEETKRYCQQVREEWLNREDNFPGLFQALIPELIIYSTGGSILAFCPAAFVDDLANAIEKRYTHETLTANSCAVGDTFKLLEFRFGLLSDSIHETFWLDKYLKNQDNAVVKAYFDQPGVDSPQQKFRDRKSFNELVLKLANQFSQRRNGNGNRNNISGNRSSRCYPPMFETHPYLHRDDSDSHNAIVRVENDENQNKGLPNEPWLSETLARKLLMGQITKREYNKGDLPKWWNKLGLNWEPGKIEGWVKRFEDYRFDVPSKYYQGIENPERVEEARSLREIASASTPSGFVAYIYADGNNMGGYIRQKIKSPEDYQRFSQDIFEATEKSVYAAIDKHLRPHYFIPDAKSSRDNKSPVWIHPFEIITIGGDDVLLVVPADKGLEIAKTIGEEFENRLIDENKSQGDYSLVPTKPIDNSKAHRYHSKDSSEQPPVSKCKLSMSTGVLITACDTPIYYADKLVSQLLKSAKKTAKDLKKNHQYYSGTVDFLVMKAVTMISSNIKEFREQGLTKVSPDKPKLKLYSSPYTLYELGGLLKTVGAFKNTNFPRSQLYQIRSLLERGKRTAILNYRYFRVRLQDDNAKQLLEEQFEQTWCEAKTNNGNIAPWMSVGDENEDKNADTTTIYETIWRDIVDLYPFIPEENNTDNSRDNQEFQREVG